MQTAGLHPPESVCKSLHFAAFDEHLILIGFDKFLRDFVGISIALHCFMYYASFAPVRSVPGSASFSDSLAGVNKLSQCCIASSAILVECAVEFLLMREGVGFGKSSFS